jgi:prevent-host-death family protein
MAEVGTFEAKNKLSELLARAERGEETVITKRGRPIAKLIPIRRTDDGQEAARAAERIRQLGREMSLGRFDWEEWKRYRDEGRK